MTPAVVTTRTRKSHRTKVVWGVLGIAMTYGMGLLSVLDSGVNPTGSGVALSPLMSLDHPRGLDGIFENVVDDNSDWQSIVIVHSGSPAGSPDEIERDHREIGYDAMGFHFLIGNGTGMVNGEIHVGQRWLDQESGVVLAGADSSAENDSMIQICLIGDGDRKTFSDSQMQSLAQLVVELSKRIGVDRSQILLHEDIAGTSSPGRYFPRSAFEELLASI